MAGELPSQEPIKESRTMKKRILKILLTQTLYYENVAMFLRASISAITISPNETVVLFH